MKYNCPKMATLELMSFMEPTESPYADYIILSYTGDHLSTFGWKLLLVSHSHSVKLSPAMLILPSCFPTHLYEFHCRLGIFVYMEHAFYNVFI